MGNPPKPNGAPDDDAQTQEELSPGGSPIYRYGAPDNAPDWRLPAHAEHEEIICEHVARYYGAPVHVFHEIISDLVHIDVHIVPPNPVRHSWLLFTTGMSALPMTVPPGLEQEAFAELMVQLPASWALQDLLADHSSDPDERWYWPIRWLKMLARFPHEHSTWLGPCHTIPNGDPAAPFHRTTRLCGWMLLPPVGPDAVAMIDVGSEAPIRLLHLHALHDSEMNLKLQRGADTLIDRLNQGHVTETLDLKRLPVA